MGQMVIPMKTERLLAVGDIHGAWDKFKSMYDKVKFNPEKDRMIFLGDYLDRGDNPVAVMDFILEHKDTMGMKFEKLPLCAEMTVAGKTFWFMHADCESMLPLVEQIPHVLLWGRSLAKSPELNQGETVIVIGHTPVQYLGYGAKPQWLNNGRVVLMDTGSSTHADGRVSCADLLSGEIYQSD